MGLHGIDALIVGAFVTYAIASGWRARRIASRGLEEYFLAGRTLSGWQAGLSMAATQFAADTPLLVTGMVATAGIFALCSCGSTRSRSSSWVSCSRRAGGARRC